MNLLSQIEIPRTGGLAIIQLLQGDLTALPVEHETDLLVMSAFPDDYIALKGSLIHAFQKKGLSIEELSHNKAADLRSQLHCWLSSPLSVNDQQKFNIKQILCFEPGEKIKHPEEVVGDIFRCINTFAFDDDNNVVAMPIIATGYQKIPLEKMLPALLQASYFWLNNGLPLDCLKLVVHGDEKAQRAIALFNEFKKALPIAMAEERPEDDLPISPPSITTIDSDFNETKIEVAEPPPQKGYDYFLSYAHAHSKEVQLFVDTLKANNKTLSVFYDRESIPPGGLWIQQISLAIQQADKVLVFLSPEYDQSPVCWDEFQCAKLVEYNRKKNVIQTVYLYGHKETEMPLIMGIYSYIDCREGNTEKLQACVRQLLKNSG